MTNVDRIVEVKSLARSFRNAFRGVVFCIRNERNMRIHLTAAAYVLIFSTFYRLHDTEYILLLLTICLVLFAECVNTSIEAAVDLNTQWYDHLARISKDVAAGAVLFCAVFAVAIGCILFLRPAVLYSIVCYLIGHPFRGVLFLISLPVSVLFIFCWPQKTHIRK